MLLLNRTINQVYFIVVFVEHIAILLRFSHMNRRVLEGSHPLLTMVWVEAKKRLQALVPIELALVSCHACIYNIWFMSAFVLFFHLI